MTTRHDKLISKLMSIPSDETSVEEELMQTIARTSAAAGNAPQDAILMSDGTPMNPGSVQKSNERWAQSHHGRMIAKRKQNQSQQLAAVTRQRDELLAACKQAADWLCRSIRIDDQEQADDLRAAIARAEGRGRE